MDQVDVVIIVFILLLVAVGFFASRRIGTSANDYLLGGRKLGGFSLGISAAATGNSGFIMIGAVGLGYQFGISFVALPLAWLLGDLVFWAYFPHRMNKESKRKQAITVPAFLSNGASSYRRAISLISAILLVVVLGSYTASQFTAITKASSFIGYSEPFAVITLTVIVVLAYSAFGGFISSVWTDLFQAFFMFLVTTAVLIGIFATNEGIVATFTSLANINPEHMTIGIPLEPAFWSIIGFFVGWASASLGFGLSQPQVVSRYFAGVSEEETKKAKWVYISFLQYTWIGMTVFGAISKTVLNEIEDPELALLEYASSFNEIFIGLIFVGVISAVISTLDSMFVSIGGIVSDDLIGNKIRTKYSNYRWFRPSIVILFALIVSAISLGSSKTVFELSALAVTFLAATLAPAMAYVTIKREPNGLSILAAMISGMIAFVCWKLYGNGKMEFDALIGFLVGSVIAFVVDWISLNESG